MSLHSLQSELTLQTEKESKYILKQLLEKCVNRHDVISISQQLQLLSIIKNKENVSYHVFETVKNNRCEKNYSVKKIMWRKSDTPTET